ncbi:MAG: thioredoxin [Sediminispirochaetaceae bacterium]
MAGITVTAENFEQEVLKADVPVIVDFWAAWCVPCKMIHPILDEIAKDYDGKVKVVKVNVDNQGELASQYNIISIPTLLLFKDGTVVNQQIGAGPRQTIEKFFKDHM